MTAYVWVVRPLVLCIVFWIVGLALGLSGQLTFSTAWVFCGCAVGWFLLTWWKRWFGWSTGLLVLWLAVGSLWGASNRERRERWMGHSLQKLTGKPLWGEGWVVGRVQRRDQPGGGTSCKAPFFLTKIGWSAQGIWKDVETKVLLKVRYCRRLQQGVGIRMRFQLREPRWYANPGNFNLRRFAAYQGIRWHASTHGERMVTLARKPRRWSHAWETMRQRLLLWIRSSISESSVSALLQALLLGCKTDITSGMREDFARTGTSHMLAISGLHLAIVCSLFWWCWLWLLSWSHYLALRGWHRTMASILTLPGALLYVGLSGGAVSTQRALVMVGLFLVGGILRRPRELANTLAIAALLVLLYDPTALFSLSFQLSFGAVIVLAMGHILWFQLPLQFDDSYQPPTTLQRTFQFLKASMFASAVASFALLPLTLASFPQVPLWAPVANLLAVPLGGYLVVGLGLLSLGVGGIHPGAGAWLLSWSAWFGTCLLRWVHWVSTWPGASMTLPPMRWLEMTGYYLVLFSVLSWKWLGKRVVWLGGCGVLLFCVGVMQPASPKGVLQVQFLDVGQGDAALVRFPQGTTMLVDAGGAAFGKWDVGARVLLPALRHLRVRRIDIAVLSHPHPDHFGGFAAVAEKIPIGAFWHTGLSSHHPTFRRLLGVLRRKKVPLRWFAKPQTLTIDGVKIEILHPFPKAFEGKGYYWVLHANNNSIVMRMKWGRRSILFTGDVEYRAEQILCERYNNLRADVLKVPHHGSRTSSTALLLDNVRPTHALFGVGRGNTFGFPHSSVLQRYKQRNIRMWRTDLHGMITVQTDGDFLRFSSTLQPSSP